MGEPRSADAARIGGHLRELRAARGLSLRQLAKLIGASPSLLSQVENGKVTPSVDTLSLLARALETPLASFFGAAETVGSAETSPSAGAAGVVRAGERQRITLDHGVTWENLLPRDEQALRFMEIRYGPGAHSGEHFLRHPGRDLFLVLEGELSFRVGFTEHRLGPGDSISFGDFQPHHVRNDGTADARAIVCVIGDETEGGSVKSEPPART